MAAGGTFGEFLQEQLTSLGHVTVRRMFGGAAVYCDGLMFGLVSDDTLYFRVDDGNRGDFEAEGLTPFTYDGKGRTIVLPYWRVPERLFDEPEEMIVWAQAALAAARRVAAKKKSKKAGRGR
jgi:DNA transformation protein and related proteins